MAKPIIFIDANIFLGCYERKAGKYRDLLKRLEPLAPSVLFTRSFRDEILRNKLKVYLAANAARKFALELALPETHHLPIDADEKASKYVESGLKEFKSAWNALEQGVKKIEQKNLEAILSGNDDVSVLLEPLNKRVQLETEEQLARARTRREFGNPPGKPNNPLGDQISWEQLLDEAKSCDSVWIVSSDNDFKHQVGKQVFLNPFLRHELSEFAPKAAVYVFDNLASFFAEYAKQHKGEPATEKPEEIADALKEYDEFAETLKSITTLDSRICPSSPTGQHEFYRGLVPKHSRYGGLTYWQLCQHCGASFDTGESYDE